MASNHHLQTAVKLDTEQFAIFLICLCLKTFKPQFECPTCRENWQIDAQLQAAAGGSQCAINALLAAKACGNDL